MQLWCLKGSRQRLQCQVAMDYDMWSQTLGRLRVSGAADGGGRLCRQEAEAGHMSSGLGRVVQAAEDPRIRSLIIMAPCDPTRR